MDLHERLYEAIDTNPLDVIGIVETTLAERDAENGRLREALRVTDAMREENLGVATAATHRADRAEAERDRFAEELTHQINLHTQKPGHHALDRRVCQSCKAFRELRELPSIAAAQVRIYAAIGEALSTGNYVACPAPEDAYAQRGDQPQAICKCPSGCQCHHKPGDQEGAGT